MAKRLWCVLLTAVMLLNLLPVGMADGLETESVETLAEPAQAAEMQPEEEASEESSPDGKEPESFEEAAEELLPEEEAKSAEETAEDEFLSGEKTEPVEELPVETLDLLTDGVIPDEALLNEELSEDELSEELEAAAAKRPGVEEEEERIAFTPEQLAEMGIETNETIYMITPYTSRLSGDDVLYMPNAENVVNVMEACVLGNVTIILPDDYDLYFSRGLAISTGHKLTIRVSSAAKKENGKLRAKGGSIAAGIGGWGGETCGDITIESGIIEAEGGQYGAGIGGGRGGGGGNIVINGGTVTARGGQEAAGIGGGGLDLVRRVGGSGGNVTINGGTVKAFGGASYLSGAGIGGGCNGSGGRVTVNNGNVTAEGGGGGAGIGGGHRGAGGAVVINGGDVTARGGVNASGIGSGESVGGYGEVTITNGNVKAFGGNSLGGAGIGGGCGVPGCKTYITGGIVTAIGGINSAGIGNGYSADGTSEPITISGGKVTANGGAGGAGIGGGFQDHNNVGEITIRGTADVTANGGSRAAGIGGGCEGKGGGIVTIEGGKTMAVGGENGAGIGGGYQCSGADVKIIDGIVIANGGLGAAGIGGGAREEGSSRYVHGGTADIRGGTVTANAGTGGAGIGSGSRGDGGVYTISGGTVTANGGQYGAGIGGGNHANGAEVTIIDGTVTAIAGTGGAGIGGGSGGGGRFLTVRGGKVTATGGENAAGIGGGEGGWGSSLIVSGGEILATGGAGARAIGRGHDAGQLPAPGSLELSEGLHVLDLTNEKVPTQITIDWRIDYLRTPMKVLIGKFIGAPAGANLTYNGREQNGYLNPMQHTRVEGTTAATNAGTYEFTVVPEPGYTWFDHSNAPKTASWSIGRIKATVKANDQTITYGERDPLLTARVTGTINRDRLIYQLTRESGKAAGTYKITPSGDKIQNAYDVTYQTGTLTIRPKNVSENRRPESLTLPEGSGDFKEPVFHDRILDEDIPGKLTYTYNGQDMTKEKVSGTLAGLRAETRGTIYWRYEASENFAGTIRGSINFRIASTTHVHRFDYVGGGNQMTAVCGAPGCPIPGRRLTLTLNAPANPVYDANAKEVRFRDGEAEAWEAAMGSLPVITYTADRGSALTGGKAVNAGSYTASITLDGEQASTRFRISKAEYTGVTKTASGELNAARGSTVTITLPAIPQGASYGRPPRPGRYDPYTLSDISGSRITVTSAGFPAGTDSISFTVPVLPDGNHTGYAITVTVKILSSAINVTVKRETSYIRVLGFPVPVYTATISASSPNTRITRVEHSLNGQLYTPGNQITSLLPIAQFYIRVTDSSGTRYNYVYRNGQVIRR